MARAFASQGDLSDKTISFTEIGDGLYAFTAEGDPNSGVIVGDDAVMVIDATATPVMARSLIEKIRSVTSKPIKYVVLSHYHAVRVLGASAFKAEGAQEVIASRGTLSLIRERGAHDMRSEIERFPRLFQSVESIPGLTWPTLVFEREMTLFLGQLEVQIKHVGAGHTSGDTIVWLPGERVLFSGDLVEYGAAAYTGDAQLAEWPQTLERLRALNPDKLVPGRGPALLSNAEANKAIDYTKAFVTTLFDTTREAVAAGADLKRAFARVRAKMDPVFGQVFIYEHCLPFDVSRAFDEASGVQHPRIWTAERDQEMWRALQD
jgi:glyoxylase-like metal-dependent hydrolase (beta-lactamase superfamily II)